MIEYIDKGAAKRAVDMALELDETEYKKVCAAIDNVAPAADVMPVVRCKDCRWRGSEECGFFYRCDCGEQEEWATDSDFCSYGEREE